MNNPLSSQEVFDNLSLENDLGERNNWDAPYWYSKPMVEQLKAEHRRIIAEKQAELEKLQHLHYEKNAEIERLIQKTWDEATENEHRSNMAEVERLKKELEDIKRYGKFVELKPLLDGAYQAQRNEFIAEGERRAMQRVKEAIEEYEADYHPESDGEHSSMPPHRSDFLTLKKKLGLSEESQSHRDDGTCECLSWDLSDKDDEVQP